MSNSKEFVEVTIDLETGESSVEAFGFRDGKCRTATAPLETALGKVKSRKVKDPGCEDVKVKVGK
jgi:hypothetical protein